MGSSGLELSTSRQLVLFGFYNISLPSSELKVFLDLKLCHNLVNLLHILDLELLSKGFLGLCNYQLPFGLIMLEFLLENLDTDDCLESLWRKIGCLIIFYDVFEN